MTYNILKERAKQSNVWNNYDTENYWYTDDEISTEFDEIVSKELFPLSGEIYVKFHTKTENGIKKHLILPADEGTSICLFSFDRTITYIQFKDSVFYSKKKTGLFSSSSESDNYSIFDTAQRLGTIKE